MFTVNACMSRQNLSVSSVTSGRRNCLRRKFNYELFNCSNINIRYWSWNYRGCWHQTCPPIDFAQCFKLRSLPVQTKRPDLLCLLTTSLNQDWVIYAPAAFRRNGSRFSGSLSGIEPQFPATRDRRGSPIHYHQADRAETYMM